MGAQVRHYNDLSNLGAEAPNVDHQTGIRVGFISQHTPMAEALDDITTNGTDLTYEAAVEEAKAQIRAALVPVLNGLIYPRHDELDAAVDAVWDSIEQTYNDHYEADQTTYRYEKEGYVIEWTPNGSLACVSVIRSPFFTLCAFGSPCIPNAGDLDTPGDVKTYCLGVDWFEKDQPPYNVYEVATGKQVYAVPQEGEQSA